MSYYLKVLKNYFRFSGRARKSEYWYFYLINLIITFILWMIENIINSETLSNIYAVAIFIPSLAVTIRRMHDTDRSGWYFLIPIYNIILLCTSGTIGENRYGADPK